MAFGSIRLCVPHEVRIAEAQPPIGEAVYRLLPADHAIGTILEDHHHEVELEAHRGLELLTVHHEAAIAAHGDRDRASSPSSPMAARHPSSRGHCRAEACWRHGCGNS